LLLCLAGPEAAELSILTAVLLQEVPGPGGVQLVDRVSEHGDDAGLQLERSSLIP